MRRQIGVLGILLSAVATVGVGGLADAADVYYINGATDAAYWVNAPDFTAASKGSPDVSQSQTYGSQTPPRNYLGATWSYAQPSSSVTATLPLPQQAYGTGLFSGLIAASGNFTVSGQATAGAQADSSGAGSPLPPNANGANSSSTFSMNFSVTSPQSLQITGSLQTGSWPASMSFWLAEGNPDGSTHQMLESMDNISDPISPGYLKPINVSDYNKTFTIQPGYLYHLYVYTDAGFPWADGSSDANAALTATSGSFNMQGTFSPVPEPAVVGIVVPMVLGGLARRRRVKA